AARAAHATPRLLDLDWAGATLTRQPRTPPHSRAMPDNLAYVVHTSGSTGTPKGTAIPHRAAVALLSWPQTIFTPGELAGTRAATALSFDLSVFELFAPLCVGGTVILAEHALAWPSGARPVTLVNTVPSVLAELLRLVELPASVQTVNLAGEALPARLVQQLYARPHIRRVYNLYGPSEDTTYSTYALLARAEPGTP